MAGIAELLSRMGYQVSGSDVRSNELTKYLTELGVVIEIGHNKNNLPKDTSVVVYSTAIPKENVEILEAQSRGAVIIRRAEMLAELMRMRYGIAVGGSHGKTTTTSMVSHVLKMLGLDPTVAVGGRFLSASLSLIHI